MRPPRLQAFCLSLGIVAGIAASLSLLWVGFAPLSHVLAIGFFIALVGWTVAEQVPDQLDRAVGARLHWLLVFVGALPFVGIFGAIVLSDYTPSSELVLYSSIFAFAAVIATSYGSARDAKIRLRTQTIHAAVSATKLRRYHIPLTLVSSVVGIALLRLALGRGAFDGGFVGQIIGSLIGVAIGISLVDDRTVTLTVLDDCFLVSASEKASGSAVPWRRIRRVSIDGDTLRIALGLPWPMVYEVNLSKVSNPDSVLEAFRSRLRWEGRYPR